jgi:hypothetical protein
VAPNSQFAVPAGIKWSGRIVIGLFLGALAIRWAYALALYLAMGKAGVMGADSMGYLQHAQELAGKLATGTLSGWDWLGPNLSTMPMLTRVLAASPRATLAWEIGHGHLSRRPP